MEHRPAGYQTAVAENGIILNQILGKWIVKICLDQNMLNTGQFGCTAI
jgi:hypothetical protein